MQQRCGSYLVRRNNCKITVDNLGIKTLSGKRWGCKTWGAWHNGIPDFRRSKARPRLQCETSSQLIIHVYKRCVDVKRGSAPVGNVGSEGFGIMMGEPHFHLRSFSRKRAYEVARATYYAMCTSNSYESETTITFNGRCFSWAAPSLVPIINGGGCNLQPPSTHRR